MSAGSDAAATDVALMVGELRWARDAGEPAATAALNLAEAVLSETDLIDLELSGSDFSAAELSGAQLQGAHLCGVALQLAVMHGACLEGAEQMGPTLRGTDMSLAPADRAGLGRGDLEGTVLFAPTAEAPVSSLVVVFG